MAGVLGTAHSQTDHQQTHQSRPISIKGERETSALMLACSLVQEHLHYWNDEGQRLPRASHLQVRLGAAAAAQSGRDQRLTASTATSLLPTIRGIVAAWGRQQ